MNSLIYLEKVNSINKVFGIIFFCGFILASFVELYLAFKEKEHQRKIAKMFCVPLLFLTIVVLFPTHPLVYLGLLFGSLGDFFLILKHKVGLKFGVVCFFIGHILYLSELYSSYLNRLLPWWFYLVFIGSILLLALIIIFKAKSRNKHRVVLIGGAIYYSTILGGLISSLLATIYLPTSYLYFIFIGYSLFVTSDLTLFYSKFIKAIRRNHFYIMLTYLLAQLFIVLGFGLTFLYF